MKRSDLVSHLHAAPPFPSPSYALEQYKTSPELAADIVLAIEGRYRALGSRCVADLGCGTGTLSLAAAALGACFVCGFDVDAAALGAASGAAAASGSFAVMDFALCDVAAMGDALSAGGGSPAAGAVLLRPRRGAEGGGGGAARAGPQPLEEAGGGGGGGGAPGAGAAAARAALARWEGRFDTVLMNPPFGTRRPGVDVAFLRAALALVHSGGAVFSLHKSSTRAHLLRTAASWGVGVEVVAQLRFDIPPTYVFHAEEGGVDVDVDLLRLFRGPPAEVAASLAALGTAPLYEGGSRGGRRGRGRGGGGRGRR
jgi:predicted RNA methylase